METLRFLQNSGGQPISTVEEWLRLAPPRNPALHWKPGRSAMEFAKAWFPSSFPVEIAKVLETESGMKGFAIEKAVPEWSTRLDDYPGGKRNNDMLIIGKTASGSIVVTVEAKAGERFGSELIGGYRKAKEGTRSNVPRRIRKLSESVFGQAQSDKIDRLRYQLLHSFAATLIEAKEHNASQAALIIYQCGPANKANDRDLESFIRVLSENDSFEFSAGRLYGPYVFPKGLGAATKFQMFIGKTEAD